MSLIFFTVMLLTLPTLALAALNTPGHQLHHTLLNYKNEQTQLHYLHLNIFLCFADTSYQSTYPYVAVCKLLILNPYLCFLCFLSSKSVPRVNVCPLQATVLTCS